MPETTILRLILYCVIAKVVCSLTSTQVLPTTQSANDVPIPMNILTNQYQCYIKLLKEPAYTSNGGYCPRTWDGWLCWEDIPAGSVASQFCPNYFIDFDISEKVRKICNDNGQWFRHPMSDRTWSNYTLCNAYTKSRRQATLNQYYMAVIGNSISIISLVISLIIFFYFKSLSCQRITLHKNLFISFLLNSIVIITHLSVLAQGKLVDSNPVWCKVLSFIHNYLMGCNYFWMLCEGIHLQTLIVVAVFAEEQQLFWYYLLGWGFPVIPALIHAIARLIYFNDFCWISTNTNLIYILNGAFAMALLLNVFFLLNIVRVLVTKLRLTHHTESHMYMKAVRATLILLPLLGIQYIVVPWIPQDANVADVYESILNTYLSYQGLLVSVIFCFFNGEVQTVLKRQWKQCHRMVQHHKKDTSRSASCTGASLSETTSYTNTHSDLSNGRQVPDVICLRYQPFQL
uniref:Calcitonin gene-related peptide type 1 receptor n=1 Tax=Eptatretus burgeri TaxID=7764 RepID=A0A8C4Q802_EPTBU